jgi:hypothetical protein
MRKRKRYIVRVEGKSSTFELIDFEDASRRKKYVKRTG